VAGGTGVARLKAGGGLSRSAPASCGDGAPSLPVRRRRRASVSSRQGRA
jgi:hypothetical protein